MLKRQLALFMTLLTILVSTACSSEAPKLTHAFPEFVFSETRTTGYAVSAKTSNAEYFFQTDNAEKTLS